MKFLSYRFGQTETFGGVKGDGAIDLGHRFESRYAELKEMIAPGDLPEVANILNQGEAADQIFGLTLMNEGTIRDWLRHGKFNVTQGKNFHHSGDVGP